MKYRVKLYKIEYVDVIANDPSDAFDQACDILDNDPFAFAGPVDEYEVEAIKE